MRPFISFAAGLAATIALPIIASAQGTNEHCLADVAKLCGKQDASACFTDEAKWQLIRPECEGDIQALIEMANEAKSGGSDADTFASWGGKVRSGPGVNFKQVGLLAEGHTLSLDEDTGVMMNGYSWFKISYADGNGVARTGYQWGGIICAFGDMPGVHQTCPAKWAKGAAQETQPAKITEDAIAPAHGNSDEDNEMLEAEAGKTIAVCIADENEAGRTGAACINRYANDCLQRDGNHTTVNMRQCIGRELTAWDTVLNEEYRALMASLQSDAKKKKLRQAQRNWIKFSQSFCPLAHAFNGGTLHLLSGDNCMMDLTARQAIALRLLAGKPEGN